MKYSGGSWVVVGTRRLQRLYSVVRLPGNRVYGTPYVAYAEG